MRIGSDLRLSVKILDAISLIRVIVYSEETTRTTSVRLRG